jgi:hypothetical protein
LADRIGIFRPAFVDELVASMAFMIRFNQHVMQLHRLTGEAQARCQLSM